MSEKSIHTIQPPLSPDEQIPFDLEAEKDASLAAVKGERKEAAATGNAERLAHNLALNIELGVEPTALQPAEQKALKEGLQYVRARLGETWQDGVAAFARGSFEYKAAARQRDRLQMDMAIAGVNPDITDKEQKHLQEQYSDVLKARGENRRGWEYGAAAVLARFRQLKVELPPGPNLGEEILDNYNRYYRPSLGGDRSSEPLQMAANLRLAGLRVEFDEDDWGASERYLKEAKTPVLAENPKFTADKTASLVARLNLIAARDLKYSSSPNIYGIKVEK